MPIAGPFWGAYRFWAFHTSPWSFGDEEHPSTPQPSRYGLADAGHIEQYVMAVASLAEKLDRHQGYPYDVTEALPDELPEGIDPETADNLVAWLEPAIDRAVELLALLERRAAEDWPDDDEA